MVARSLLRVVFLFAAGTFLTGCISASNGPALDSGNIAKLHKGMSRVEVETLLGPPSHVVMAGNNGERTLIYNHTDMSVKSTTFVPIVGLFAGGTDTRLQNVQIMLDANGIVRDFESSDKTQDANSSVFTGSHITEHNNTEAPQGPTANGQ